MLAPLLITLREGLEAALIVAVVLAYVRQVGSTGAARPVWLGVGAAVALSAGIGALLLATGRELEGAAEALFEIAVMLAAAGVLTYTMLWMQRQAAGRGARLRQDVRAAVAVGGSGLFLLAFFSVLREGVETALFLLTAPGGARPLEVLAGGVGGLALAVAAGYAVYRGSDWLPFHAFFTATNVVLVGFAAYLLWGAAGELGEILGGEAFELAGPVIAAVYVGLMVFKLRQLKREAPSVEGTSQSRAA